MFCEKMFLEISYNSQVCNFVKKDSDTGIFLSIFSKFLRTPFLAKHLWWLLLDLLAKLTLPNYESTSSQPRTKNHQASFTKKGVVSFAKKVTL